MVDINGYPLRYNSRYRIARQTEDSQLPTVVVSSFLCLILVKDDGGKWPISFESPNIDIRILR